MFSIFASSRCGTCVAKWTMWKLEFWRSQDLQGQLGSLFSVRQRLLRTCFLHVLLNVLKLRCNLRRLFLLLLLRASRSKMYLCLP